MSYPICIMYFLVILSINLDMFYKKKIILDIFWKLILIQTCMTYFIGKFQANGNKWIWKQIVNIYILE